MRNAAATLILAVFIAHFSLPAPLARAGDWPQWRGPDQTGISTETGLLDAWPDGGPTRVWERPIGNGFSGIAVVAGRLYTMAGDAEGESVICLDADTGDEIWKARGAANYQDGQGGGPRGTPTVHEGKVYSFGATGMLLCLDAQTGERIWGFNALRQFNGQKIQWGMSSSPYIEGNLLILNVGGQPGKSVVALDKETGDVVWTSLNDIAGYSTAVGVTVDGMRQLILFTGEAVVGLAPDDGRELWRYPWRTAYDVNAATPIFDGGRLFISSGYDSGAAMLHLTADGGQPAAREVWTSKEMKNRFSSSILVDGHLYGFSEDIFTCMNLDTGEVLWRQRGFNKGTILYADGKAIVLGERGQLALGRISPAGFEEISRADGVISGKTWTIPTLANGRLFLRNEEKIVCLDLRKPS